MNKELLNEITISNCFDDKFYPNWDDKITKCPSNNKFMCKEFNKEILIFLEDGLVMKMMKNIIVLGLVLLVVNLIMILILKWKIIY